MLLLLTNWTAICARAYRLLIIEMKAVCQVRYLGLRTIQSPLSRPYDYFVLIFGLFPLPKGIHSGISLHAAVRRIVPGTAMS